MSQELFVCARCEVKGEEGAGSLAYKQGRSEWVG